MWSGTACMCTCVCACVFLCVCVTADSHIDRLEASLRSVPAKGLSFIHGLLYWVMGWALIVFGILLYVLFAGLLIGTLWTTVYVWLGEMRTHTHTHTYTYAETHKHGHDTYMDMHTRSIHALLTDYLMMALVTPTLQAR